MFCSNHIFCLTFAFKHSLAAGPKLNLSSCFKLFTLLDNPYIFTVIFFTSPFPLKSLQAETLQASQQIGTGRAGLAQWNQLENI